MKKFFLMLILIACSSSMNIFAQGGVEYGKPEELKGITKVFVDTGADMKVREQILKELQNAKLSSLTVLDSEEGAEVILQFTGGKQERYAGSTSTGTINSSGSANTVGSTTTGSSESSVFHTSKAHYKTRRIGAGAVFLLKPNSIRLLMSFDDVQKNIFEKKPATNFAREFIKQYKRANGIK